MRRGRLRTADERALLRAAGLRRMRAGSNALYALGSGRAPLCLKLYTATGEANARREWAALALLQRHGYPFAPAPLHLDTEGAPAALVMERLAGATLRYRRLTRPIMAALVGALQAMYRITQADADDGSLPVVLNHQQIARVLPEWVVQLDESELSRLGALEREAVALAREWAAGPDPELIRRPAPLVFSRTDANFLNCLWDGRRVAIVDYEFAGWKDRVIDLADLLEVDAATAIAFRRNDRPRASAEDWAWFVDRFGLRPVERRRLLAAQRWLNWHFAFRNWPPRLDGSAVPARVATLPERFAAHVERARSLSLRWE